MRALLVIFVVGAVSCEADPPTFTLPNGSRLVLDERGRVCGPGSASFANAGTSWGKPDTNGGTWQVADGTGPPSPARPPSTSSPSATTSPTR